MCVCVIFRERLSKGAASSRFINAEEAHSTRGRGSLMQEKLAGSAAERRLGVYRGWLLLRDGGTDGVAY